MKTIEYRRTYPMEVREVTQDGDNFVISGIVNTFNERADIGGMFTEEVLRGAFKKTLRETDQVALWNHDTSVPLGRRSAGTLSLKETESALEFEARLDPRITTHNDAYLHIQRGDVKGMSFGFMVMRDKWDYSDPNKPHRSIMEVRLEEISPVTFPAYTGTAVEARAVMEAAGIVVPAEEDPMLTSTPEADEVRDHLDAERKRRERRLKLRAVALTLSQPQGVQNEHRRVAEKEG